MLLTTEIKIKLGKKNCASQISLYDLDESLKPGDEVAVPINKISTGSHHIVEVSCDYCGKKINTPYRKFIKSTELVNKCACSNKECSNQKIKDICQIKYGVDNPFQDEKTKNKIKETLKSKYGVEHAMHLQETKEKIKKTSLEKYGVTSYTKTKEYLEKTKNTNLNKYGVEFSLQSEEIKNKGKATLMSKYGVEYSSQTQIMREKTIQTCIRKWGFTSNSYSEECKQKLRETSIERYGVDNPMKSDLLRKKYKVANDDYHIKYLHSGISLFTCDKSQDHNFEISTSLYLSRKSIGTTLCTICNPVNNRYSDREESLYDFIKEFYKGDIIRNFRDKLEIDIYIPEFRLGIEFNGIYWHSEEYKDKNFHLNKTEYFNSKGIRIIHIWEDDWMNNPEIIKSQIRNWMGNTEMKIFARNCEVKEITDNKFLNGILESWHIQGRDNSILKIGLYYRDELVSVMTFDKFEGRKKLDDKSWNLSRFCTKLNHIVIGGASKILKYFIKNYNPDRIISYADRSWSSGNLYDKLGFKLVSHSKPDYKYVIKSNRIHKSNFRKAKLKTNKSETEYMKDRGIMRIWDCGKLKFEMKIIK